MKKKLKNFILRFFGRDITDIGTGRVLGRALVFFWRGRLLLLGYQGPPLRVEFVGEMPFSYSRRVLGFRMAEIPDFPRCSQPVEESV